MRGLPKTIARNHENATLGQAAAEVTRVATAGEPREGCHAAGGTNPIQPVGITREELVEESEVLLRHLAGAPIDLAAVLQREGRQMLAENARGDCEVVACI